MPDNYEELTTTSFDRWQKEFEKEHPILAWIDRLFGNRSLAGYATHYTITHPWIILESWGREIKWAWQRVFHGWDERVVWSIDFYLAKMIPLWMRELKECKGGVPTMMFKDDELQDSNGEISDDARERAQKEYDDILEKIAMGFDAYIKMDNLLEDSKLPEYKIEERKFNEGFELLHKYFGTLWD